MSQGAVLGLEKFTDFAPWVDFFFPKFGEGHGRARAAAEWSGKLGTLSLTVRRLAVQLVFIGGSCDWLLSPSDFLPFDQPHSLDLRILQ